MFQWCVRGCETNSNGIIFSLPHYSIFILLIYNTRDILWNKFHARCDGTHSFVLVCFFPQKILWSSSCLLVNPKWAITLLLVNSGFTVVLTGFFALIKSTEFNSDKWGLHFLRCGFCCSFVASCMLHMCVCGVLLLG